MLIPSVDTMDDETLMKHLELRHEADLRMEFREEPDYAERRMYAPREWRTYHDTMHRLQRERYKHEHLG